MNKLNTFVASCVLAAAPLSAPSASTLEGEELSAFDAHCPLGNFRAVWAEPLSGHLEGWINLVCLNEDLQETSYWYVTPEGIAQAAADTSLPDYIRPLITPELESELAALASDEFITVLLDFDYEHPDFTPEQFGAPTDISGGVFGSAGSDIIEQINYILNGELVTQSEYEIWETAYEQAVRDMEAEIDRLVEQQVHLNLYELVELNQWHDWLDVDAINSGISEQARWLFPGSLILQLWGDEAQNLVKSAPNYLRSIEKYDDVSTDGVIPSTPELGGNMSDQVEPLVEPLISAGSAFDDVINELGLGNESELASNNITQAFGASNDSSGGGSVGWFWLLLWLGGVRRLNILRLAFVFKRVYSNEPRLSSRAKSLPKL